MLEPNAPAPAGSVSYRPYEPTAPTCTLGGTRYRSVNTCGIGTCHEPASEIDIPNEESRLLAQTELHAPINDAIPPERGLWGNGSPIGYE